MINAKSVKFKNLFSVGNTFQEFDLKENSNLLVVGKSGHGKSTIIDAITFALFGRTYKDLNKGQLINSINKKNLVVEFEFNEYKVIRGISPNLFEIYKDGELIPQTGDVRDYQKNLEKNILNMNYKSFTQVVVLGSAAFMPFMKLQAAHRREVIEDLLDLHVFSKMSLLLKSKNDINKAELADINIKVQSLKSSIKTMNEMIEEQSINSNEEIQSIIAARDIKRDKTTALNNELKKLVEEEKELLKIKDSFPVSEGEVVDKILALNKKKTAIITKIDILKKTITFIDSNDDCPTCKQDITFEYKASIVEENNKSISELDLKIPKIDTNLTKCNNIFDEIKKSKDDISAIKSNTSVKKTMLNSMITTVEEMNERIDKLKNKVKSEVSTIKLDALKREITLENKKYDKHKRIAENYVNCQKILKDNGIKSVIINKYIPLLNQHINSYLEKFDMFVSFELDSSFNETIKSRHRDKFSYNSFSEGQKKRIDFSILLAMRDIAKMKNSVACNLLIIDELMDGLDVDNVDNLENILSEFDQTNTIIISHSEDIKNRQLFDKTIKAELVKNFTTYEEV
ncbi:MAG: hypothetical protein COA52_01395 [Hyphomicrobiales bacterium]|nr:MAG: hypothetical protein COA52_00305 [Hyphomicrobiales bacterium]PCJ96887.1 MAG: hypothetical protein COA52_01395 [Hyphomicrobiales bacterium]